MAANKEDWTIEDFRRGVEEFKDLTLTPVWGDEMDQEKEISPYACGLNAKEILEALVELYNASKEVMEECAVGSEEYNTRKTVERFEKAQDVAGKILDACAE
ncbi:MAG: hypothetical protein KAV87_51580 [Desulfobacteraceae bacterium]|nr:hypothetical protein [Desulfobacteraceae bacterium]